MLAVVVSVLLTLLHQSIAFSRDLEDRIDSISSILKHRTHLNGNWDYFFQNFSLYPVDNPLGPRVVASRIFEFISMPRENVIRCMFVETWPWLFIERDENGFVVWGPFYSLAVEAAKLINYT